MIFFDSIDAGGPERADVSKSFFEGFFEAELAVKNKLLTRGKVT